MRDSAHVRILHSKTQKADVMKNKSQENKI